MKLQKIIEQLDLKPLTKVEEKEIDGVFISDMLSDVMSNAKAGDLWITVQTHKNIVSAANLVDMGAIIIVHGKTVPEETIDIANRFHVNIFLTPKSTFELAGKLVALGLTP
ncbi:MAG: DRTGG domain-containing protein [Acidobacteriota bacterium]